jgi:ribonuclease HII
MAGIDEAGRGPLAGPLVASAVRLRPGSAPPGIADSKVLSDRRRRELTPLIMEASEAVATGIVDSREIDSLGMSAAVRLAFERAAAPLAGSTGLFLIDGLPVRGLSFPAEFVVDGDARSLSIAAASIIAKVARDDIMLEADLLYPGYGFAGHKGYGSRSHIEAIRRLGPCPIHRLSFRPLSQQELF